MALITIDEANASLNDVVYPEWDLLDDEFRQVYIDRASAWVRLNWTPPSADTDFDYDDDTTWDDVAEIKNLIAQYSDMVGKGELYQQGRAGEVSEAPIKRKTQKVGSLELTTEYAQSDEGGSAYLLAQIDDQMKALGFTFKNERGTLVRV